ncbi:class I SAM-dependent methyltransferase [Clostridium sp.]|uniref:class I SAM-dependent methyltransferase n=1 Tax=Clostridium sp. TaxID=1506 RepID=UPI00261956B2|nr:class I SAM-dependent methyltransferase [Clostridium sp.]
MDYKKIYKEIGFKQEIERLKKQAYLGYEKEIRMLKLLGFKDKGDVLEIGSGPGFYTSILFDNFKEIEITSLDYDMKLLKYASDNLNKKHSNRVTYIKDDVNKLSLPDNSYDFVIARFVFQHLDNPFKAISEIYRVLKPGGKVFIIDVDSDLWGTTFPKNNSINEINNIISRLQGNLKGNREIGSILTTILKNHKFKNLDIEAVINHSDILGKENFRSTINSNMIPDKKIKELINNYNDFFDLKHSSIMVLKLFISGEK